MCENVAEVAELATNSGLFDGDVSQKSQGWADLFNSAQQLNSESGDNTYDNYGGFCAWNGAEMAGVDHLTYPTKQVCDKILEYSPADRIRLTKFKKSDKKSKQKNPSYPSLQMIGRHSESRAVHRQIQKSENEWHNEGTNEAGKYPTSTSSDCIFTKSDYRGQQLVLPKVGSYRTPAQIAHSRIYTSNVLKSLLKGDISTTSVVRTQATPFLPPIMSQTIGTSPSSNRRMNRYRCQLPPKIDKSGMSITTEVASSQSPVIKPGVPTPVFPDKQHKPNGPLEVVDSARASEYNKNGKHYQKRQDE